MDKPSTMTPGPTTPIHWSPRGSGGSGRSAGFQAGRPERASTEMGIEEAQLYMTFRNNAATSGFTTFPIAFRGKAGTAIKVRGTL